MRIKFYKFYLRLAQKNREIALLFSGISSMYTVDLTNYRKNPNAFNLGCLIASRSALWCILKFVRRNINF